MAGSHLPTSVPARPPQRHRGPGVTEAVPWIFLQAAPQQRSRSRRNPLPIWFFGGGFDERVGNIVPLEKPLARQRLVSHHSKGPNVGSFVDRVSTRPAGSREG